MRRSLLLAVLLAGSALAPGSARAAPVAVDGDAPAISVFDLVADGGLMLTVAGEAEPSLVVGDPADYEDECWLESTETGWWAGFGACWLLADAGVDRDEFHVVTWTEEGEVAVLGRIPIVPADTLAEPVALDADQGGVILPEGLTGQEAALQLPGWGWLGLGAVGSGGFVDLDLQIDGLGDLVPLLVEYLQDGYRFGLRTRDGDGAETLGFVEGLAGGATTDGPAEPTGGGPSMGPPPGPLSIEQQDEYWIKHPECPVGPDRRGRGPYVICLDLTGRSEGTPYETRLPTDDFILRPNRAFVVYVRHFAGEPIEVAMTGDRGLYMPRDLNATESGGHTASRGDARKTVISRQQFGPQLPGETKLAVQHTGGELYLEFAIQPVYIGAIRVGLGMVFNTPEREYTIVRQPGSQTSEIAMATTEPSSPVAAEIVIGFAPFVFQPHGRGYFGRRGMGQRVAPYVGLGILQTRAEQDNVRFSLLRSIYLGVEVELTAHASVAAAFVLGRTDRLKQPYRVGGPIEPGLTQVPTTPGFLPGMGLVINFSPDFLRFSPIKGGGTP